MDRWHAMRVFVKVGETGSFAGAGRQLNMSPPAVTRIVSSLEETIGARLLTRTTRSVRLTDAGSRYLEDCERLLHELNEVEAAAAATFGKPTGTLSITAPSMFGSLFVMPLVTEFLDTHPEVIGRAVFADRIVNLMEEEVDVAIRIGHLPDSGYAAIRVGEVRRVICGSPAYFQRKGIPEMPSDLAEHRIIATTNAWSSLEWKFGMREKTNVRIAPRLFCSTNEAAILAAVDGWGITRVLSYQIAARLDTGELRTVLSDHEEETLPIHVVHSDGRHASAKVRSFVDFAVARLRANRHIN
jgi:DNA-binding transcriptional LysR family regulator